MESSAPGTPRGALTSIDGGRYGARVTRARTAFAVPVLLLAGCGNGGDSKPAAEPTSAATTSSEQDDRWACRMVADARMHNNVDPVDNLSIGTVASKSTDPGIARAGKILADAVEAMQAGIEQRYMPHLIANGHNLLVAACFDLFGDGVW